ncbi:MAG: alpha/beta fold hydrolase [Polyangiales bacterium]
MLKHAAAAALHDASGALTSVRAPTLVLAAGEDPVMGTAGPRALAEGIADARFEVIEGAGHDLTAERPEAVASRVAAFFGAD